MAHPQEQQYNIAGVTVYDPSEIAGFAAQIAVQRHGERADAQSIADIVEVIYREDGYFLAEVFVGADGQTLVVDEGEIGALTVEGADAPTFDRIRAIMDPVIGRRAVTQAEFERAIMLVEDIGSVTATAEIDYPPGSTAADLRVITRPVEDRFGHLTLDHPSQEFGEAAILTYGERFLSLLAPGDMLRFELSGTAEFDDGDSSVTGTIAYRFPIGPSGAFIEAYAGNVAAVRDRDGTLDPTEIEGSSAVVAFGYPVLRDVETYGYALLEFGRTNSLVTVDSAMGPDVEFGVDVWDIAFSWIHGRTLEEGGAWEYGVNLTYGERIGMASGFDDGDNSFTHLRFGLGYEHPGDWFGPNSSVRAEFWGQVSADRLPSVEQFHIGGRAEDRAYLFAEAQGDSGFSGTFEISRDHFPSTDVVRRVRPFGFLDAGWVENNAPSREAYDEETFASLGLGVDLELNQNVFVRTYVATPLLDGPSTNAGEPAFYLGLTRSW